MARRPRPRGRERVLVRGGRGHLLLGLEILVAADLVRTIAIAPTLDNVFTLGLIVLIRTFLSFSLETEISGMPPWRRGLTSAAGTIARARDGAGGQPPGSALGAGRQAAANAGIPEPAFGC